MITSNNKLNNFLREIYSQKQSVIELKNEQIKEQLKKDSKFTSIEKELNSIATKMLRGKALKKDEKRFNQLVKKKNTYLDKNKISLKTQYECKKCNDTGFIARSTPCSCSIKYQYTYLESLPISSPVLPFTFKKSKELKVVTKKNFGILFATLKIFEDQIKNDTLNKPIYFISGYPGTGKSYLLYAIYNELKKKDKLSVFTSSNNLFTFFFKFHMSDFAKKDYSNIDILNSVDVLLIDDLGTEPMYKNITKENLFNLLDVRINNNLTTIISTNLKDQDFLNRYEERIFSRINDETISTRLHFEHDDIRLKK